jgi:hypothetical protein
MRRGFSLFIIDTAKALYYNATLEKLSFLKLLKKREHWLADQEEALTTSIKVKPIKPYSDIW